MHALYNKEGVNKEGVNKEGPQPVRGRIADWTFFADRP
jgi:hypothetical protein